MLDSWQRVRQLWGHQRSLWPQGLWKLTWESLANLHTMDILMECFENVIKAGLWCPHGVFTAVSGILPSLGCARPSPTRPQTRSWRPAGLLCSQGPSFLSRWKSCLLGSFCLPPPYLPPASCWPCHSPAGDTDTGGFPPASPRPGPLL